MAGIFLRKSFAMENMPQVSVAISTEDFNATTISVSPSLDRVLDFVVETRPAASGMELVLGPI